MKKQAQKEILQELIDSMNVMMSERFKKPEEQPVAMEAELEVAPSEDMMMDSEMPSMEEKPEMEMEEESMEEMSLPMDDMSDDEDDVNPKFLAKMKAAKGKKELM